MKKTSYEWGFSLVELAIGLLVIGLLIGGVFKGRHLLQNARIQDTIAQISDYQLAVASFVDRYQALPGDFQGASGIFGLEGYDGNQDSGYGLQAGSEAVGFWQHLAAAKLIQSHGAPRSGQIQFGSGAPASSLGGGFSVETFSNDAEGIPPGLWLILGTARGNRGIGGLLTPAQAAAIDKKLDSGNPTTGQIRAKEGVGFQAAKCVQNDRYNLKSQEPACVLYISIQN